MKSKSGSGNINEISSRQNVKFKFWLSLLEAKGIKKEGHCLVSGEKVISELLREDSARVVELLLPPKSRPAAAETPATLLASELFQELDVIGTRAPLAVVRCEALPKWAPGPPKGLQVVLALSDPSNLGALLRSCEAFHVNQAILTKECCSPYLPRALRASAGSAFRLSLVEGPSLKDILVENAFGLDMNGQDMEHVEWPLDMCLVLGEEGQGLPEGLKLTRVRIPMAKTIESLNAMAAASIALYSYRRRFPL